MRVRQEAPESAFRSLAQTHSQFMGEGSETFRAHEATYGASPSCFRRVNAGRCYPHPASATLADLSLVRERCKRSARDAFRYLLFLVALGAREVVLNDRPWIVQAPIVRRDASLVPNRDDGHRPMVGPVGTEHHAMVREFNCDSLRQLLLTLREIIEFLLRYPFIERRQRRRFRWRVWRRHQVPARKRGARPAWQSFIISS